jgi:hypothetical protein
MTNVWPWLAIAALGATHGLSPANGWMFAAACGLRARDAGQARRSLLPIAVGHAASIGIVAAAVAQGMWMYGAPFQRMAGALLLGVAAWRLLRGSSGRPAIGTESGKAGIALWSFLMASAQGTGLMLVPALVPLCLAANPARGLAASGSLPLAAAAVGVHTAAMLAVTGLIATGVCRGLAGHARLHDGALLGRIWTGALLLTGMLLLALA